jgi:hypothetical protein
MMNPQKDLAAIATYKVHEWVGKGDIIIQYSIPFDTDVELTPLKDKLLLLGYGCDLFTYLSIQRFMLFVMRPVQAFERPPSTPLHDAMTTTKGAELAALIADREVLERKIRTALDEFHAAHPGYKALIEHVQTETDTICAGTLYGNIIHVKVEVR